MAEKWAQDMELKEGGLKGWAAADRPAKRRAALRKSVSADGYATTVRRLNVLINLDSPQKVQQAARADMSWLKRTYREEEQKGQRAPEQQQAAPEMGGDTWRTRQF